MLIEQSSQVLEINGISPERYPATHFKERISAPETQQKIRTRTIKVQIRNVCPVSASNTSPKLATSRLFFDSRHAFHSKAVFKRLFGC
ncbi:hypothetical protein [Pseudomonas lini]